MILRNKNYYPDGNEKTLFRHGQMSLLAHWKNFATTTKFQYDYANSFLIAVDRSESLHLRQVSGFENASKIMSSNARPFPGTENISTLLDTL